MRTREVTMYKIVNNNIHITRGETATYNVRVIDKVTGAPFILPKNVTIGQSETEALTSDKFMAVFSVRKSDYIKDGYAIKKYLWFCGFNGTSNGIEHDCSNDIVLLDETEILDYNDTVWTDDTKPQTVEIKQLYRRITPTGGYDYRYWDANNTYWDANTNEGTHWIPYEFVIRFPFLYNDTATLSPKAYKYAMTIYGGNNLTITPDGLEGIDYKKPLVDAQFIVEADINE